MVMLIKKRLSITPPRLIYIFNTRVEIAIV